MILLYTRAGPSHLTLVLHMLILTHSQHGPLLRFTGWHAQSRSSTNTLTASEAPSSTRSSFRGSYRARLRYYDPDDDDVSSFLFMLGSYPY